MRSFEENSQYSSVSLDELHAQFDILSRKWKELQDQGAIDVVIDQGIDSFEREFFLAQIDYDDRVIAECVTILENLTININKRYEHSKLITALQDEILQAREVLMEKIPDNALKQELLITVALLHLLSIEMQYGKDSEKVRKKEEFSRQEKMLGSLLHELKSDAELYISCENIMKVIKALNKAIPVDIPFDDSRINIALELTKKENGGNPGYTVTNHENTKFTVKKGSTLGNTLSEVFSSMVLSSIVDRFAMRNKSQVLIAKAFLIINKIDEESAISIEDRCRKSLFAASQWSSDKASFEACNLLGLKKRIKAAGTRLAEEFKKLLYLNAMCDLGLENIVIPTALIADFDLHTENFMLKINDRFVKEEDKSSVELHIEILRDQLVNISDKNRIDNLICIIETLKMYGAKVYFHKIDHDSGFYRYAHSERKIDLLTHRTSPVHRVGLIFKVQPTLHVSEITGGTKEGMDQLFLSEQGIDRLLNVTIESEINILNDVVHQFFMIIKEKCNLIGKEKLTDCQRANFYLLSEFYCHLTEKITVMPQQISEEDINGMMQMIYHELESGARLKIKDLHSQLYKRLLEKEKNNEALTAKQIELKLFFQQQDYLTDITRKESERKVSMSGSQSHLKCEEILIPTQCLGKR